MQFRGHVVAEELHIVARIKVIEISLYLLYISMNFKISSFITLYQPEA